jgi:hypothetical protein
MGLVLAYTAGLIVVGVTVNAVTAHLPGASSE